MAAGAGAVDAGREGSDVVIRWSGGGRLKTGPTPVGPWTDVANASSPFRIHPAVGAAYFRLEEDPGVANPIINGDFEQGPEVGWIQEPGQLIFPAGNLGGAPPFSGKYAVWLGYDRDDRRSARIGQQVVLPGVRPLFLNFALWLHSEELCDVPYYDSLTVYVNRQVVAQNERVCRGTVADRWQKYSIDISAAAGSTVLVVFEISSADNLASVALLDDIAVSAAAWAP